MIVLLLACGLYISETELIEAVDVDGDGYRSPAFGGDDCNDADPRVHPGAEDLPYDGIDADCDGSDDFDADGDGLIASEHGGTDCDDTDPGTGDTAIPWYADCDDDGVPGTSSLLACGAPTGLAADLDPCPTPGSWLSTRPALADCDDTDPSVHPGASDPPYDGIDADCAGDNDFDTDHDGFVAAIVGALPDASAPGFGDCDDTDPSVHPSASDPPYDGIDADCAGDNDFDADHDGFVATAHAEEAGGTAPLAGDCDDSDASVRPGAEETPYDGIDADCDGANDFDADLDGSVAPEHAAEAGDLAVGDCDDTDASRGPLSPEVYYDGIDADCDGANDYDRDGDGVVRAGFAAQAGGTAPLAGDCNDLDPAVFPGAPDAPYDGIDSDCGGEPDHDADGDGFAAASANGPLALVDCDDTDPAVFPGAPDAPYDGIDSDCDGANDYDADGDGSVADPYVVLAGLPGGDCDDTDPERNALLSEVFYDGIDGDCAGGNDFDADGDGVVSSSHPGAGPPGAPQGDCDDTDPGVAPGLTDAPYDGIDSDCDGANDFDADGDGFVSAFHPGTEAGDAPQGGDCDDADPARNPGATDIPYDGIDSDCDGADDFDADGDGVPQDIDCDDDDATIAPGLPDVPYDGIDSDCDGAFDYDQDGDGWLASGFDAFARPGDGVGDCDDTVAGTHPGATETWYDGVDSDCDGANDFDADGDAAVDEAYAAQAGGSAPLTGDCDDDDAGVRPGAPDSWYDGVDSDCDGADDFDADGDGVPLLADCTTARCDCDDTDALRWTADWTLSPGEDLQALVDAACDGVVLTLADATLALPEALQLDRAITLRGQGATVLTSDSGRVVEVNADAVFLEQLTLRGGSAETGGLLRVSGHAELLGVLLEQGTATLSGGLAQVEPGAALGIQGSELRDGSAESGGAIAVAAGGRLELFDVQLHDTQSTGNGGAIAADQARLVLVEVTIEGSAAGDDGGAVYATESRVELDTVAVVGAEAADQGGAILLHGCGGVLQDVSIEQASTLGTVSSIGVDPLPAALQLDYGARAFPLLDLERIRVVDSGGPVGVSIFEPYGEVTAHDLQIRHSGTSYGLVLEPQELFEPHASSIRVRNLLVEGSTTGVRLATISGSSTIVENATIVAAQQAVYGEVFDSLTSVRSSVLAATGFNGQALFWNDYQSPHLAATDLSHVFSVQSDWVYGPSPFTTLPATSPPPFCLACGGTDTDPFDGPDFTLSPASSLVGLGDPTPCPDLTSPCLDPGYWGGPEAP